MGRADPTDSAKFIGGTDRGGGEDDDGGRGRQPTPLGGRGLRGGLGGDPWFDANFRRDRDARVHVAAGRFARRGFQAGILFGRYVHLEPSPNVPSSSRSRYWSYQSFSAPEASCRSIRSAAQSSPFLWAWQAAYSL